MAKDKNIRHQGSKWQYEKKPRHKPVITNIKNVKHGAKDNRGCLPVVLMGVGGGGFLAAVAAVLSAKGLL